MPSNLLPVKTLFFLLLLCLQGGALRGQFGGAEPNPKDFRPGGEAVRVEGTCFQLTPARDWAAGSVWHQKPFRLDAPFHLEMDLMLGCKDADGADGIVFIFHSGAPRTGYRGEGMGFGGLRPALGIEVDTWENEHLLDPPYDHLAVVVHGNLNHAYGLTPPVPARPDFGDVEDCRRHRLAVHWEPTERLLRVLFDGRERIALRKDLSKEVFGGGREVFWGFAAATGAFNNRHLVCIRKLDYRLPPRWARFDDRTEARLLKGELLRFQEVDFASGGAELLPASHEELDRLVHFLEENPRHVVLLNGHTDSTGPAEANLRLSRRRAEAVAAYLRARGIPAPRILVQGFGETMPLASNSTPEGRRLNRRVEFMVFIPIP